MLLLMKPSVEEIARVICAGDLREAGVPTDILADAVERLWPVVAARIGQGDSAGFASLPTDLKQREHEYARLTGPKLEAENNHF